MELKEADGACVDAHRTSGSGDESCLSNCSPVESLVVDAGEKMKTKTKSRGLSVDCTRKIPLTDNIGLNNSTKSDSSASTNPENGPATASASDHTPSNLQQQQQPDASPHCPSSSSVSTADLESDVSFPDDREFDFLKAPLLPRSSSLKSRKTPPPGTPTHRKSVRFADALGLDLELVRHILNPDEPPYVPSTAVQLLQTTEPSFKQVISYWRLCFPHPATNDNLTGRALQNKVSLESCSINNSNRRVYGTVRVANVAYEKIVRVHYTLNGWLTCEDVQATYIEHSNDLITDRFSFELRIPENLVARSRLEFAVSYSAANQTFWDNNFNSNYALECVEYNVV